MKGEQIPVPGRINLLDLVGCFHEGKLRRTNICKYMWQFVCDWLQEFDVFLDAKPQNRRHWLIVVWELKWSIQRHTHLNVRCACDAFRNRSRWDRHCDIMY